ncbi:MAG: hypothetical protein ACQPRI_06190 [Solitalea-like symbiont of Tyrophagus putrescentiae]
MLVLLLLLLLFSFAELNISLLCSSISGQPASQPVPYPRFIRFLGEGGETNIGERRKNDYAQREKSRAEFCGGELFSAFFSLFLFLSFCWLDHRNEDEDQEEEEEENMTEIGNFADQLCCCCCQQPVCLISPSSFLFFLKMRRLMTGI